MSNWEKKRLDVCADIRMGQSPDSSSYNEDGLGLPFLQGCAEFGPKYPSHRIYTSQVTRTAPANSILISVRAPVGTLNYALEEYCIGRGLGSIKSFNGDLDTWYLYYYIEQNVNRLERISQGSTFEAINSSDLKTFVVDLPPLPERKKIAKILRTVDKQIEKTEAIIAKYKAIKQGLMQDLFTRGIDVATGKLRPCYQDAPELYKPSPLGMIPKEWDVKSIGSLSEKVGSGVTPTGGSDVYLSEGVLFIRSQNVLTGELSLEDAAYISEAINEKMVGSKVVPFDVLLNITGASIGRCAYFPSGMGEANVNQHVCIIRFKEASHELAVFASTFLNSHFGQNQIYRLNAGGNREGLNYQQIRSFSFPKIDNKEIKAISEKLEAMASKIKSEEESLAKLQLLKKGLMADLLSGKVRVQVDEEAVC